MCILVTAIFNCKVNSTLVQRLFTEMFFVPSSQKLHSYMKTRVKRRFLKHLRVQNCVKSILPSVTVTRALCIHWLNVYITIRSTHLQLERILMSHTSESSLFEPLKQLPAQGFSTPRSIKPVIPRPLKHLPAPRPQKAHSGRSDEKNLANQYPQDRTLAGWIFHGRPSGKSEYGHISPAGGKKGKADTVCGARSTGARGPERNSTSTAITKTSASAARGSAV